MREGNASSLRYQTIDISRWVTSEREPARDAKADFSTWNLQLKPLREEQRLKAIKQGLIPDPSKPMRLDQATDFEGTCEEMCPEWEREEREYQNNVDPLERVRERSCPSPLLD